MTETPSSSAIRFDGRVAIVTGSGGGLGRAYAMELARRGARIIVNDVGCDTVGGGGASRPADQTVADIRAAGGTAEPSYDSVASPQGGRAIVEAALDHFGKVDILISNAGILRSSRFDETADADVDIVIETNLKGAFHVGRPAFAAMKRQGYGRMLFVASASGLFGHPWQAAYGASKAGLLGLSNVLALEGADYGITSNALLPAALTRLADTVDWGFLAESRDVREAMQRLEAAGDKTERRLGAEWVMPLAAYLVSEACTASHGAYSAVSGRLSRVFVGSTPGFAPEGVLDVDQVAGIWPQIENREGFAEPASVYHEAEQANAIPKAPVAGRVPAASA